jgi:hypothetical protein
MIDPKYSKSELKGLVACFMVIGLAIPSIFYMAGGGTKTNVQEGYVNPRNLEIKTEDLDKDGNKETILEYGNKSYLFRVDENEKPYISEFKIEPSISPKVVPLERVK